MSNQVQLTKQGFESLEKELDELVDVKRPKVVERLSNARGEGDLSENSDYQGAKEELEFIDGRIAELEEVLKNAQVVSSSGNSGGAGVGAKITVKYDGEKCVFEMVGEWEADPVNK